MGTTKATDTDTTTTHVVQKKSRSLANSSYEKLGFPVAWGACTQMAALTAVTTAKTNSDSNNDNNYNKQLQMATQILVKGAATQKLLSTYCWSSMILMTLSTSSYETLALR